jgi:hypothetical protein
LKQFEDAGCRNPLSYAHRVHLSFLRSSDQDLVTLNIVQNQRLESLTLYLERRITGDIMSYIPGSQLRYLDLGGYQARYDSNPIGREAMRKIVKTCINLYVFKARVDFETEDGAAQGEAAVTTHNGLQRLRSHTPIFLMLATSPHPSHSPTWKFFTLISMEGESHARTQRSSSDRLHRT